MPPGKVHDRIWRKALVPVFIFNIIGLGFLSIAMKKPDPMMFMVGYLIGSFIEPDLDQTAITTSEGRLMRWFKDFGAIIVGYYSWYAYRFSHRNSARMGLSHTPIIGTFTRWVWFFMPFMIVWLVYGLYDKFYLFTNQWFWWMFLGNCFSDLLHIGADYSWKIIKIFLK